MIINSSNSIYIVLFLLFLNFIFMQISSIYGAISLDLVGLFIFSVFRTSFSFWFLVGFLSDILYSSYLGSNSIFYITLHFLMYIFFKNTACGIYRGENIFKIYFYILIIFNISYFLFQFYRVIFPIILNLGENFVNLKFNIYCFIINNSVLYFFIKKIINKEESIGL